MEFKEAGEEFLPMAKELYEKHKGDLHLSVEPEEVMFLRSDSKRKAFAYCKRVTDEYVLLTDKKYFIVIINKYFDILKTNLTRVYLPQPPVPFPRRPYPPPVPRPSSCRI